MRRAIIGSGVVVVVAASLVWWRARGDAAPAATRSAPAAPTISSQRSPELPAPPPSESPRGAREVTAADPQVNRPVAQARIADAHAHLQDAVKPCRSLVTKGSPDAAFQFSYRLSLTGGEASISDLSLVWSDYKSADLEKCLLEALAAARWTSSEADFSTTVEDALGASELE